MDPFHDNDSNLPKGEGFEDEHKDVTHKRNLKFFSSKISALSMYKVDKKKKLNIHKPMLSFEIKNAQSTKNQI